MNIEDNYSFPVTSTTTSDDIEKNYWKCLYTSTEKNVSVLGDPA
jgi:hypothetical protein